jgi:hypothetical protein
MDPEEAAALAVLDGLGRLRGPEETSVPEPEDEVEVVLRRLFHEAVGLLPYQLEPASPPEAVKATLLAGIVGDLTQEIEPLVAAAEPERPRPEPSTPPPYPLRASGVAVRRAGGGRAAWALAALLALAVAGLGLWTAYLASELRASHARLAWVEREWRGAATTARASLVELRGRFARVTAPGVTVFPLQCPTGHGPAAGARVFVYVLPGGENWELAAHGLSPEPPGTDYQVWFEVGERARSGGCFNLREGRPVISMPAGVPRGTSRVSVTVEPHGGSPRPTGPVILVADRAVRL